MGSKLPPVEVMPGYGVRTHYYENQRLVHEVTISQSFYMSRYEVTLADLRRFVDDTGYRTTAEKEGWFEIWTRTTYEKKVGADWRNPYLSQDDEHPVVCVSWYDAVKYCNWLSKRDGLTPCYSGSGDNTVWHYSSNGYRLPTEAEWEYAARGVLKGRGYEFAGSNSVDDVGWYWDNAGRNSHSVGQKMPNELGLYDRSGNVFEWYWDWYDVYIPSCQTDPSRPASGSCRVRRSGSWLSFGDRLRRR
jgi:sulfatase modifying factor 1